MTNSNGVRLSVDTTRLYQPFGALPWRQRVAVAGEILRAQVQILFSRKFAWFGGGILLYTVIVYIINYREPVIDRMTTSSVLSALLEVPLFGLAIFLNMQLIANEKDRRTLEGLFTVAGSRYKVWLIRFGTLNLVMLGFALVLSLIGYFCFADLPPVGMALNGFVPACFIGSMTLYFSVRFRSAFAAGMVAVGVLLLISVMAEPLEESRYFAFFNPYNVPRSLDPETWQLWMWQNRLALLALSAGLQFLALRGLGNRERLLR